MQQGTPQDARPDLPAGDTTAWLQEEWRTIAARPGRRTAAPGAPVVGLALSGGGIRSASIALGVLQALHAHGLLERVDYLSTVSGGGYTGIGWLARAAEAGGREGFPYAEGRPAFAWLRNRAAYLLPPGAGPLLTALAMLLRKLVANALATLAWVAMLAVGLATLVLLLRAAGFSGTDALAPVFLTGAVLAAGFSLASALLESQQARSEAPHERSARLDRLARNVFVGTGAAVLLALQPWLVEAIGAWGWRIEVPANLGQLAGQAGTAIAGLGSLMAALGLGARMRGWWAGLLTDLLALLLLLLLYVLALSLASLLVERAVIALLPLFGTMAGAALLISAFRFVSPNATSLHPFYRARLADTFMGEAAAPRLSELLPERTGGPFPVVNGALNGVVSAEEARRGRSVGPFSMTPLDSGSRTLGYCRTAALERLAQRFDAASAMALSAAAVAGNQPALGGANRFSRYLFNLRTGRWLPSPHAVRAGKGLPLAWSPAWQIQELFGNRRVDPAHRVVLISDGGHYENLGITALLHRRCGFLIVVDAEADPGMHFSGLATATRLARLDVVDAATGEGAELCVDPDGLGHDRATGRVRTHFVLGHARYPAAAGGGTAPVLYIKASLDGQEPLDVREYGTRHPSFPHETTADQFFSEEQFEAYRALGEHIGRCAVQGADLAERLRGGGAPYPSAPSA